MRITVSHNKGRQEAIKLVDSAAAQVLAPDMPGPVKMTDVHKKWQGDKMDFSLNAKMGFLSVPIKGTVEVADTTVTVECDLPDFITKFIPENTIKASVEGKVKGLLT